MSGSTRKNLPRLNDGGSACRKKRRGGNGGRAVEATARRRRRNSGSQCRSHISSRSLARRGRRLNLILLGKTPCLDTSQPAARWRASNVKDTLQWVTSHPLRRRALDHDLEQRHRDRPVARAMNVAHPRFSTSTCHIRLPRIGASPIPLPGHAHPEGLPATKPRHPWEAAPTSTRSCTRQRVRGRRIPQAARPPRDDMRRGLLKWSTTRVEERQLLPCPGATRDPDVKAMATRPARMRA